MNFDGWQVQGFLKSVCMLRALLLSGCDMLCWPCVLSEHACRAWMYCMFKLGLGSCECIHILVEVCFPFVGGIVMPRRTWQPLRSVWRMGE